MNKLFLLFLDTTTTVTTDEITTTGEEVAETVKIFNLTETIVWYSILAALIIALVMYFINRHNYFNNFHKAQLRLGKEYTKYVQAKSKLTRYPKIYRAIEKALVEIDFIKEKTSLTECDEAINLSKELLDKMLKPELLKEEEETKFTNTLGELNSKLAIIYSLLKK